MTKPAPKKTAKKKSTAKKSTKKTAKKKPGGDPSKLKKMSKATAATQTRKAKIRKRAFLKAYSDVGKYLGVIGRVCTDLNIPRQCYYDWMKTDPEFKQAVEEINESFLDFAEVRVKEVALQDANPKLMEFLIRILLRKRGFDPAEKVDHTVAVTLLGLDDLRSKKQ